MKLNDVDGTTAYWDGKIKDAVDKTQDAARKALSLDNNILNRYGLDV